ncbi:MAG: hypothetical protein AAFP97_09995 [Pseudomonadota bacterium]
MSPQEQSTLKMFRSLTPSEAATWLINYSESQPERHSEGGLRVPNLVRKMSWPKPEQMRLAEHFLQNIPHASAQFYEAFASFMPVARLLAIIEDHMPDDESRQKLLFYYLLPALKKSIRSERDRIAFEEFAIRYRRK